MPKISIEIVVSHDSRLTETLESIRQQTFQDYEVIVATDDSATHETARSFDTKAIRTNKSGTLFRRIAAHEAATGQNSLLLEASRLLHEDCLSVLASHDEDMVIVEEHDIGKSMISRIQNIERHQNTLRSVRFSPAFLVAEPRFFKSEVLHDAFEGASQIDSRILKWIQYGDLDIIYFEAFKKWRNVGTTSRPLIEHHTDANIIGLLQKYYGYGQSNRLLRYTKYGDEFRLRHHLRPFFGFRNTVAVYSLTSIKAIAFLMGNIGRPRLSNERPQE